MGYWERGGIRPLLVVHKMTFYDGSYLVTLITLNTLESAWICVLELHPYTNTLFSDTKIQNQLPQEQITIIFFMCYCYIPNYFPFFTIRGELIANSLIVRLNCTIIRPIFSKDRTGENWVKYTSTYCNSNHKKPLAGWPFRHMIGIAKALDPLL